MLWVQMNEYLRWAEIYAHTHWIEATIQSCSFADLQHVATESCDRITSSTMLHSYTFQTQFRDTCQIYFLFIYYEAILAQIENFYDVQFRGQNE